MSAPPEPPLSEIVGVWTMAFGQPPIVNADAGTLLTVLMRYFPDVYAILVPGAATCDRVPA